MSKKPLIIIDSDPEFVVLKENLDAGCKMYEDSLEFLKKQAKKSWEELVNSQWDSIKEALKKRNLLPEDYNDTDYDINCSNGVLYIRDKRKDPVAKNIFDMFFER